MTGFSIQPAPQGVYPAVCHIGDVYVPLTAEGIARLRAAVQTSPAALYAALLEAAGVSTYLKDRVTQLWAANDAAEQTRRLQQDLTGLPAG
jgi:hypothetical protein